MGISDWMLLCVNTASGFIHTDRNWNKDCNDSEKWARTPWYFLPIMLKIYSVSFSVSVSVNETLHTPCARASLLTIYSYWSPKYRVETIGGSIGVLRMHGPFLLARFSSISYRFRKKWPNSRLASPPLGLLTPHLGNPGAPLNLNLFHTLS